MKKDGLIIISVDDHIVEPPEMFEQHVTKPRNTGSLKRGPSDGLN
jgi:hypothetical protein